MQYAHVVNPYGSIYYFHFGQLLSVLGTFQANFGHFSENLNPNPNENPDKNRYENPY